MIAGSRAASVHSRVGSAMKFNPITQRLYTDDNVLIKQLHCPYRMAWHELAATNDASIRLCAVCVKSISDTDGLTDQAVLELVRENSSACLRVSLDQDNVQVVHWDV
jgi:hypothetical protein